MVTTGVMPKQSFIKEMEKYANIYWGFVDSLNQIGINTTNLITQIHKICIVNSSRKNVYRHDSLNDHVPYTNTSFHQSEQII